MKILFDLLPIVLFFAAFKLADIYVATAVAIVATAVLIGWTWLKTRKVDPMQWVSLGLIVVFGGATIWLRDETFIKWKPTILYWLFAGVLALAELVWNKNLIRAIMEAQVTLPDPVWRVLNHAWAAFFAVLGLLNLYVAFNFDTDTWVNFKLFGTTGLMFAFIIVQSLFLSKYIKETE